MSEDGGGGGHGGPVWLLTYCDLITLLVAFFVMLISFSTINVDKCKKDMLEIREPFGGGGESLLESGTSPVETKFVSSTELPNVLLEGGNTSVSTPFEKESTEDFTDSGKMYHYLSSFNKESGLNKYIDIEDVKIGCKIKIPIDLCFNRGESVLRREAYSIFDKLGTVLRIVMGKIVIDANVGKVIKPGDKFAKENDLSIDRAANICDFLVTKEDIEQHRIAIAGYHVTGVGEENAITIVIFKK